MSQISLLISNISYDTCSKYNMSLNSLVWMSTKLNSGAKAQDRIIGFSKKPLEQSY